jgi:hypothetical protein
MAAKSLKAKVLFSWGMLVALLCGIYFPQITKAAMPYMLCVAVACAILYLPEYVPQLFRWFKRQLPQATAVQAVKITEGCVKATWCDRIDYENFEFPTYSRREGCL